MPVFANAEQLYSARGTKLGTSQWWTVTQRMIDQFAEATGDHQWIHVDAQRAAAGPFGTTIAHGFLTLSMVSALNAQIYGFEGARMVINYGLNKVRFPTPVQVDSRVRAGSELADVAESGEALQLTLNTTVEIEGSDKPACVAEVLSRVVF
ncbi:MULTISPECIES: MaoC family dehydratase [Actinopolyspora]|uniref:Acyl dehydratase n=1 Tax=Actinopolyspora saharensis TaxID=995062 RepID=A0A1H1AD25_9ACTN|nr:MULTISPECIES: MaoC family dehydratase [Actinopolyspora]NHD16947.1 MaoC family dehydratase [Actinopolyspora sp. BKK2]NHE76099.1 MaoC family dehydratase [Actinopolyspora sp. BKK1]SDQ37547.1 Acyl dehydratase [Actinopolyspora saharensis]